MFATSELIIFIGSSIVFTVAPGPDVLFTITQGITKGRKAGVMTAMGLGLGNTVHTAAAALGLSVIFRTSEIAFFTFKVFGAAYLFYLAYKTIRHRNEAVSPEKGGGGETSAIATLAKGFIMNVLNPKVALFFLAFLPQFAHPEMGNIPLQISVLGLIFIAQVLVVFGLFGYFAGSIGSVIMRNPRFSRRMSDISALVFIGIGIKLALSHR